MEEGLYQHHVTVTGWMGEFEERCQDHFTYLEEVLQVAAENYQNTDVEVLPKTPSVKCKTRRRKPVVLSSEDDDFVEPAIPKSKKSKRSGVGASDKISTSSPVEGTDDEQSAGPSRSTRSTRSTRSNSSNKSTRSAKAKKKVLYADEEDEAPLQNAPTSMESISELDETDLTNRIKDPTVQLFRISEGIMRESMESTPVLDNKKNENRMQKSTEEMGTPSSPVTVTHQSSKNIASSEKLLLNSPLQRLKKALTPISPRVSLKHIQMSYEGSSDPDMNSEDLEGSFAAFNVKDKVRAYHNMINKRSPALNRSVLLNSSIDTSHYTSTMNITLSNERLPAQARIIRQISNSPQTKRTSETKRRSTLVVSRRSSMSRKSDRIQQQASRMSLSKRKSYLMKNRASVVVVEREPEPELPPSPEDSTPKPVKIENTTPVTRESSRKRQFTTDSDSSQNTPSMARKRVRSEKMAQSPRVKQLKETEKSSDSEYVTDDSDVPMSPAANKRNRFRTPPKTLVGQRATPHSRSPGLSGSFIKRNTPKGLTIKERQEIYKRELTQKRKLEERRLEKIRSQKQQELERQKRKREDRHQQVQAKRLAQQRAATEQSITTVKSKERRGSAIIREQREKAELERQKRMKKQAEVEERRRQEEEKRLQKIREKEEEARMMQAMMQRKKDYEEKERQARLLEEKRQALEDKRKAEDKRQREEADSKRQREEAETRRQEAERAARLAQKPDTSLNTSQLNRSLADSTSKHEQESYNIDDIRSDDETDDEDAPKKEIPPWAQGQRMKASMIHQHYKPPNIDEIFPPSVLLLAPELSLIFPHKHRPRFSKRTSSAVWSPIQKHFMKNLAS